MDLDVIEHQVLNKLEMLSEGGTLNLNKPSLHAVHPGSSAPPGVDEEGLEGAESLLTSLWAFHMIRLEQRRESSYSVRLAAITEAEKDYETAIRRPPTYIDPDSAQNADDRDEAILRWEGKAAEWVAVMEGCSFSHVRKLRRLAKRSPKDGRTLELVA